MVIRFLILFGLISFFSCKTKKDCGCTWSKKEVHIEWSMQLGDIHEHVCDSVSCTCVYIEPWVVTINDTTTIHHCFK